MIDFTPLEKIFQKNRQRQTGVLITATNVPLAMVLTACVTADNDQLVSVITGAMGRVMKQVISIPPVHAVMFLALRRQRRLVHLSTEAAHELPGIIPLFPAVGIFTDNKKATSKSGLSVCFFFS